MDSEWMLMKGLNLNTRSSTVRLPLTLTHHQDGLIHTFPLQSPAEHNYSPRGAMSVAVSTGSFHFGDVSNIFTIIEIGKMLGLEQKIPGT